MGSLGEVVEWAEGGEGRVSRWHSDSGAPRPERVVVADDRITADGAYRLARDGVAMVWRGDFQNARQLLTALARRVDRGRRKTATTAAEAFHLHRRSQARRARTLGMLLVPVEAGLVIPLRRAPDVRQACVQAHCPADQPLLVSLRQLLGIISAHEWRKRGVAIPALGDRIHPHYGVFSPVRGEYVELLAQAPLPSRASAYDIGTGTGVLAAVLARRGVERIVATEQDRNALACARENITRLGLDDRVDVVQTDLFPAGRAGLVVCNPPWVPAWPSSPLEHAIYDPESRMLRAFLSRLTDHLEPGGEGWLVLSDLAEHLGLRSRSELLSTFEESGLDVAGRADIKPRHPRVFDRTDPLHAARAAEVTSLWRLTSR
ncbi:MAG: methyltransferase [Pseudonocardiaceae bacterium]